MLGSRAWRALMRRNVIYRVRNWIGTILEVLLPILFVGILVAIKEAVESSGDGFDKQVIPAYIPNASDAFVPLTFGDYLSAVEAKRVCRWQDDAEEFWISGMAHEGRDWQVPLIKCDHRKCARDGQDAKLAGFCEYGILATSPSHWTDVDGSDRADNFMQWVNETYATQLGHVRDTLGFELIQKFSDPTAMDRYVQGEAYGTMGSPKIALGIVWEGNDPDFFSYRLRQNSTNYNTPQEARPATRTTPDTSRLLNSFAKTDRDTCAPQGGAPLLGWLEASCTGQYLYNGVLTVQRLAGDYILHQTTGDDGTGASSAAQHVVKVAEAGVGFVPFPQPSYEISGFYSTISTQGPILVVLGLLYPVAAMISYIGREKELRQKELMKMMSVQESDIGWSWFVTFAMLHLVVTAICTAGVSTLLYENSSRSLLVLFWILTWIAVIVFCMLVSTLTSKTTRNILIGLLVFFMGVFLTLAVDLKTGNASLLGLISLHPVTAFSYGLQEIGNLEDKGVGIQGTTITETDNPSGYTFQSCLRALIVDSVLWGIVTWYLNRVIPPDYGQALALNFPFQTSYWFPKYYATQQQQQQQQQGSNEQQSQQQQDGVPVEPVGDALERQSQEGRNIQIRELRKVFGEKIAVDGLNLSMYSGQITALLGHNGAGKTTTINMLTGAMSPTDGYAMLAGKDIRFQTQQIRQDLGICLQHDCLFPMLTVREHVQFFSRLKGLYSVGSREQAERGVDQAIRDVALWEKRNTLSKNLSGGMKRKLSVAIAFAGGSKIVLLDEPTSGMDPFSRRFTWNVIRQYRQDRCIILTTHFMDEADILGDRIAIMAEGQLRCAGSSMFLKKTYGVGYQLTIEKDQTRGLYSTATYGNGTNPTALVRAGDSSLHANDEELEGIVTGAVGDASLLTDVGSEISFQLPMGAASQFGPMFQGLDSQIDKGTISSYGLSITTLDEVFLLVARGETAAAGNDAKQEYASSSSQVLSQDYMPNKDTNKASSRSRMDLNKEGLFLTHLGALFKKRAANFRRDKKAWCCTTIVPSVFVLIGFILFKFVTPQRNLGAITLSLDNFNPGASAPRNPVAYNNAGSLYTCQPGQCAYKQDFIQSNTTDEANFFCGAQARLDEAEASCTINESSEVAGRINNAGAVAMGVDVETVKQSSLSLFETSKGAYETTQYGAIWFTHETNSTTNTGMSYSDSVVEACTANTGNDTSENDCSRFGGVGYVIQYNFTALHVTPLFQALADEALIREAKQSDDFEIQCSIDPLPITATEESFGAAEDAFSAWFLVVLSFPFITGAFASFVVVERQSKAKHLQTVAGVQPGAYWLSTYLWDVMNYQIPMWTVVIMMFAFNVDVLTTTDRGIVYGIITVLWLFGPASAGFTYCLSFAFSSPEQCNLFVIISGFLVGLGGPLTTFILTLIGTDPSNYKQNLIDAADIVSWVLRFIPSFNLGKGVFYAINIQSIDFVEGKRVTAFSSEVLLLEVVFLAWQSVAYLLLAMQLDKWSANPRMMSLWHKLIGCVTCRFRSRATGPDISVALPDDDDVIAEQQRVLSGGANGDLIVANQLTKVYDNGKVAVKSMALGIPPGQCFGLLGINGAGKTTTMGMLTAEFPPSSGDATLAGFSVTNEPEKTRRRIGYCPQFDAHFANMTGREHVELYASIKGIPGEFVKEAAAAKLKEVGLSEFDSDRMSSGYSGGMKRRLSLACATIGQPQIVFLDECSTGVDPVARREIWQLVSDMVTGGNVPEDQRTSVILTTHSMEECEALCPRIGIMTAGRLRCLGSAQHLKDKFGQGFQVEMKVKLIYQQDQDFVENSMVLARTKLGTIDEEAVAVSEDILFNLEEVRLALQTLTGDTFLSEMVTAQDPIGYNIWKDAHTGVGVPLDSVAAFATMEIRMKNVADFVAGHWTNSVLRERQDGKVRYEVSSEGIRISSIFATIENNKDDLQLADYGVSQTSLEQVFNMHAAEAERLKQGRNDG